MRLDSEFLKLPLIFDAAKLAEEVTAIDPSDWITHPGSRTNLAVILVSVAGDKNHAFSITGQMSETDVLKRCPYVRQVLHALQTPISRTRLMIIGPNSECPLHDDIGYHWYRRTRVHIPIVTNPNVRFNCNGKSVHMKAGECWTFDNFLPHSVMNDGDQTRIHLVADTIGSDHFWDMVKTAERPFSSGGGGGTEPKLVPFDPNLRVSLGLEPYSFRVLTPSEVETFCHAILADLTDRTPEFEGIDPLKKLLVDFQEQWMVVFSRHGHDIKGLQDYYLLLNQLNETQLIREVTQKINRFSLAGNGLQIFKTLFFTAGSVPVYSPDSEVLNLMLNALPVQERKAG